MKYNFDELTDRTKESSIKWDVKDSELPMWVADMDFKTPNEVISAFKKRIDKGTFGYTYIDDEWYDAYIYHFKKRFNYKIKKEWLVFSTGVIPTISSAVRRLTEVANNVVLLTPIYNTFFNSIINNGRHPLTSNMIYKDGKYEIDYADLESKLSLDETTLMIFCNPHNPIGKVWTKDEMERIGALCNKYNVKVISDEIHQDLLKPGVKHIPFASVNKINSMISITCIAPTKTFNLAGIQTSAFFSENKELKHLVERGLNTDECAEPNVLALIAPKVCYKKCDYWIDELNEYIDKNRCYVREYLKENIKDVKLVEGDALYLLWLDFSDVTHNTTELRDFIREKTGLFLSDGEEYRGNGISFLRMNIATQIERVKDGMDRLKRGIELYKAIKKD